MADQPNAFHVTDVALGEMQLFLSLIVYKQLTALEVWTLVKAWNEKE